MKSIKPHTWRTIERQKRNQGNDERIAGILGGAVLAVFAIGLISLGHTAMMKTLEAPRTHAFCKVAAVSTEDYQECVKEMK